MKYDLTAKIGTKPKVVIYKRVSDKRMTEEGYSIEVQGDALNKLAESNGWEVLEVFEDDGKSARNLDRKDMQEFLDYCDENSHVLDGALIQDTSRLCRNVPDHLMVKTFLRKRNIKMIPLDGFADDNTPEGEFVDLIIAGVNELESKRTGKKTKRVMLAMVEMGLKPGIAPLGYVNSFQKGVPMKVDKEREHFIKEAFRMWNTGGYSLNQICDELYKQGLRSINGNKVNRSAMGGYLQNIIYAGGLKYDGIVNEKAQHKAVISMGEFNKAQEIFEIRNKGADRSRKHSTLLAGIAYCLNCGQLMYGEYHLKANYYRCKNCKKTYADMTKIDSCVSDFFTGTQFTNKGLKALRKSLTSVKRAQSTSLPSQKKTLTNRKTALEKKMGTLEDKLLYGDDYIDKKRIKQKYEPLKLELKQAQEQLETLRNSTSNLKDSEIDKIIKGMERIKDLYSGFDNTQKKQFLRFFVTKVFVDSKANNIAQYELVPEFEALVSGDLVRIASNWLPRLAIRRKSSYAIQNH